MAGQSPRPFLGLKGSLCRLGTTTLDTCGEDAYGALLQRFQRSEEELRRVAGQWLECQKRIDAYVDEQVGALGPGAAASCRPWKCSRSALPFRARGAQASGVLGAHSLSVPNRDVHTQTVMSGR